jgi:hypothetical protein
MPFTFSHPAIILALAYLPRRYVSLTGLVIGSLAPDFEYFLRMSLKSTYSHTIEGLFWFNLPLGLLLTFIFHNIIRNSLLDSLPTFLQSKFSVLRRLDWNSYFKKNWIVVVFSILIGASSHILWDNFTHAHSYFVRIIPLLTNTINLFGEQIPIFRILQHLSTLIGGLVIIFVIYKLPTDKTITGKINLKYWTFFAGLTLCIIGIRFLGGLELQQYGNVIVTAISAGLISLILTPYLMKTFTR